MTTHQAQIDFEREQAREARQRKLLSRKILKRAGLGHVPKWERDAMRNPLLYNFLEKVARACASELVFEALSRVFADTVEKFEKPNVPISATTFWDNDPPVGQWDHPDSNPLEDMRAAIKQIEEDAGYQRPHVEALHDGGKIYSAEERRVVQADMRKVYHDFVGRGWRELEMTAAIGPVIGNNPGENADIPIHHAFIGVADGGCKRCGEPQLFHPECRPRARAPCSGSQRQNESAPECDECWGTGAYHGWGKDCSKGCQKP